MHCDNVQNDLCYLMRYKCVRIRANNFKYKLIKPNPTCSTKKVATGHMSFLYRPADLWLLGFLGEEESVFDVLGELHHREHQTRNQNVFSGGLHPSANIWDHKPRSKSESENNAAMSTNNPSISEGGVPLKPDFDRRWSSQRRQHSLNYPASGFFIS